MKYTTYGIIRNVEEKTYLTDTKVYEADIDFGEGKIILTINQDDPYLEEFKNPDNISIYRMRIEEHQVINFMILNKLEYEDSDHDDKYCRIQYKIESFLTPKFIRDKMGEDKFIEIKESIQKIYEAIQITGNIFIHEIEEDIEEINEVKYEEVKENEEN